MPDDPNSTTPPEPKPEEEKLPEEIPQPKVEEETKTEEPAYDVVLYYNATRVLW